MYAHVYKIILLNMGFLFNYLIFFKVYFYLYVTIDRILKLFLMLESMKHVALCRLTNK